jgi:hypothetical protein
MFTEYKQRLQQGEESAAVRNGSYLLKDAVLYKKIQNHWGDKIKVEVLITQDTARELVKKVHHKLGHLGIKAMLATLQTRVNVPYA